MKCSILKLLFSVVFASTLILSCIDDDVDLQPDPGPVVVGFGNEPSSSMIASGSVDVIPDNTVWYHIIDITDKPEAVTSTHNHIDHYSG